MQRLQTELGKSSVKYPVHVWGKGHDKLPSAGCLSCLKILQAHYWLAKSQRLRSPSKFATLDNISETRDLTTVSMTHVLAEGAQVISCIAMNLEIGRQISAQTGPGQSADPRIQRLLLMVGVYNWRMLETTLWGQEIHRLRYS